MTHSVLYGFRACSILIEELSADPSFWSQKQIFNVCKKKIIEYCMNRVYHHTFDIKNICTMLIIYKMFYKRLHILIIMYLIILLKRIRTKQFGLGITHPLSKSMYYYIYLTVQVIWKKTNYVYDNIDLFSISNYFTLKTG